MNIVNSIFSAIGQRTNALSDLLSISQKPLKYPEENFDWVFPQPVICGIIVLLQMSRLPERSSL